MNWSVYGINGYKTTSKPIIGVIHRPQGFIVNELPGNYGPGDFTHFTLKKINWTTVRAIQEIAKRLNVSVGRFSYAGNKDKNAITTQRVSAFKVPKERLDHLKIKDIEISQVKKGLERISLGSHKGNEFKITLSEVKGEESELNNFVKQANKGLPNFFGPQRFGVQRPNTHLIGRSLLDRDYEKALKIILCSKGDDVSARDWLETNWGEWKKAYKLFPRYLSIERRIISYLINHPKDYVSALKQPHKMIRLLWINAWQAYEWNKELSSVLVNPPETIEIKPYPMIPEMPELHDFKGGFRQSLMHPKLSAKFKNNELILEFNLGKGSYATIVLHELIKQPFSI